MSGLDAHTGFHQQFLLNSRKDLKDTAPWPIKAPWDSSWATKGFFIPIENRPRNLKDFLVGAPMGCDRKGSKGNLGTWYCLRAPCWLWHGERSWVQKGIPNLLSAEANLHPVKTEGGLLGVVFSHRRGIHGNAVQACLGWYMLSCFSSPFIIQSFYSDKQAGPSVREQWMCVNDIQVALLRHQPLGNVPICLCQGQSEPHTGGFISWMLSGGVHGSSGDVPRVSLDLTVQKTGC